MQAEKIPTAPKRPLKEDLMKAWLTAWLVLLAAPAFAQEVPQIPFDASDPLVLPKDLYLGEVTGVAVNSKGSIFVLSRGNTTGPAYAAAAAQLLEFAPDGKFVRRGRVLLVFGRKQEASDKETGPLERPNPPLPHEDGRFRQVTDVAFDPAGNAYISDGYINSRVAKVDRNGKWLKSWGSKGSKPGEFNTPHSIAADAKGNIYVADRGNRRIQVFDGEGAFQREFTIDVPYDAKAARPAIGNLPDLAKIEAGGGPKTQMTGAPWTVCITPGPNPVLYASDAFPGRVFKLSLEGKVLGVLGESGKQLKQFGWIHEIACPSENVLYVAELLNWRVQKLVLNPKK